MLENYRKYFDIDPDYFPQVNEDIINNQPDHWKKFYPHETFVHLIKDTINVLTRRQKVSLWVEGAYGTGKSHAVLTLKKLLEASETDTKEYFARYPEQLSSDLYNSLQQIKSGEQKILTVHRYGSSNINGDSDLVFAIQESIINELNTAGLDCGDGALKDSAIKWLSEDWAKQAFDALVKTEYTDLFNGDDVDKILHNLNTYTGEALKELMSKIMLVGKEKRFAALSMDVDDLVEWIKAIIKENNLKAIAFIWDEFTEYFRNNMRALTGFQKIVDVSGNDPFYMIIVTHNVTHIFSETDKDWKKIMGRFVQPICNIELPENMAFRLMGEAMEENEDSAIRAEWEETKSALYERTYDSRKLVKTKAGITDTELKKILPIHPYAALLLKHISSAFDSNQRSMFDFIKNDRGDEIKGFQWFIDNCGPYDENPLLTIDMLWDFFYEKGKEFLAPDIRAILDCYSMSVKKHLDSAEERVLKTVLLLEAISQKTGDSVELFIPNEDNLNNAFEGTDLENDEASRIANNSLMPDILFKKPLPGGKSQYSAMINTTNMAEFEKAKQTVLNKTTTQLIQEAEMQEAFILDGGLRLRYEMKYVSKVDFKSTINTLRAQEGSFGNKILAVVTFAKDDGESVEINRMIKEALEDPSYNMVFIDASMSSMGKDLIEQYAEAMAYSLVNAKLNKDVSDQYARNANDVLKKWRNKMMDGEFIVYSSNDKDGYRANTIDLLHVQLEKINRKKYSEGLETIGKVNSNMWQANSLPAGVECGAKQSISGLYKSSNTLTKLENYLGEGVWQVPEYWIKQPYLPISKIKIKLDELITASFEEEGQISIASIYSFLKDKNGVYGCMPCNLTAFVLGFLLKEYTEGSYNWSDGLSNEPLTVIKLKEMVAEVIKNEMTPIPRYKDKYIGRMTPEEKAFNEASSEVFKIPLNLCVSVENTRDFIRQKMKELAFPIWVLKYSLDLIELKFPENAIVELIEGFAGIANNGNFGGVKSDKEIAMWIGKICLDNPGIATEFAAIVGGDHITEGMEIYLKQYSDGILLDLAVQVGDNGQYINRLKDKFKVDAANWVWNKETANQKIDDLILEYKIIVESNKILPKNTAFTPTVDEWCDRCKYIKVSYLYAKNHWEDLSELMHLLYQIKNAGILLDSQREMFLNQISSKGTAFNDFYNEQTKIFKVSCSFLLDRFSDEEIREIFKLIPSGVFTSEKADYQKTVEAAIEKFVSEQSSEQLKKLWRDKTGTDNPYEWSKKYQTPILCLIEDKDILKAKKVFAIIAKKQPTISEVESAKEFLEHATFFDKLLDKDVIDEAFRTEIIKSNDVMLDDLEEVRAYLAQKIDGNPYEWFGLPEVDKKLNQLAEYKYNQYGCDKALSCIDHMDVDEVKKYLKELIKSNMIVGMEIIKGK